MIGGRGERLGKRDGEIGLLYGEFLQSQAKVAS